jgi:hypothetical protein
MYCTTQSPGREEGDLDLLGVEEEEEEEEEATAAVAAAAAAASEFLRRAEKSLALKSV